MTTLLEKAMKGKRSAINHLYEENKGQVYFLCCALVRDKEKAAEITAWAFREMWVSVCAGNVDNEEYFTKAIIKKTVERCKRQVLSKNPKAFKVGGNNGINITSVDTAHINVNKDKLSTLLDVLPEFHRFVLVLRIVAEYNSEDIASLLEISKNMLRNAQEAELRNIARVYDIVKNTGGKPLSPTKEILQMTFDNAILNVSVPEKLDENIRQQMNVFVKPVKWEMRKQIKYGCIVGFGIALIIVTIALYIKSGDSQEEDNGGQAAETTQEVTDETKTTDNLEKDASFSEEQEVEEESSEPILPAISELESSANTVEEVTYYADIMIEDYGTITVALDEQAAPKTVENFVELVQSGFYDGLTFHRIMEDFMMQGGDPNGDGTGGSENTIVGEFSDNGHENNLTHTRGAISMARSSDYDSASSQFFIVHEDSTFLDGQYAAFGYVTEGMDIVDAICESAEPSDDNGTIPSEEQPVIKSVVIRKSEQ